MSIFAIPAVQANGLVALLAVGMCGFANKGERGIAFVCATLLFTSWVVYLLSWTPYSPDMLLNQLQENLIHNQPYHFYGVDIWAIFNAIVGIVALLLAGGDWLPVSRLTWWGPAIFGLALCACCNDALWWLGTIDWEGFKPTADFLFKAEESLFFAVGGRGAVDWVVRAVSLWWRNVNSLRPAYAKTSLRRRG